MKNDIGLRDLARVLAPDADIVAASHPEPVLRNYNVIATFDTQDTARNAVLALESFEDDDAAIGLTALGHERRASGMQPEDGPIAGDIGGRTIRGAVIGAIVAVVVITGAAALIEWSPILFGVALGSALFGAFIGGVWGAFVRMGGSDAYRQSFIENSDGITLVSLHTNDRDKADQACGVLGLQAVEPPSIVLRDGNTLVSSGNCHDPEQRQI